MEQKPSLQENPKLELIRDLRRLKTEHKDNVWFQAVTDVSAEVLLEWHKDKNLLSKEFFKELFTYHKKLMGDDNPLKERLTNQADINEVEAMIDKVIAELEK